MCRNAAIWSLSKEERADIHKRATDSQKKFIYLPLNLLQKTTNINQLVRKSRKDHIDRKSLKEIVEQIHKRLVDVESWLPNLSALKFLDDDTIQSNEILDEEAGSLSQSICLLGKRKVIWKKFTVFHGDFFKMILEFQTNSNEKEEISSGKQIKIVDSNDHIKPDPEQTTTEERRAIEPNIEVKPNVSNQPSDESVDQMVSSIFGFTFMPPY